MVDVFHFVGAVAASTDADADVDDVKKEGKGDDNRCGRQPQICYRR